MDPARSSYVVVAVDIVVLATDDVYRAGVVLRDAQSRRRVDRWLHVAVRRDVRSRASERASRDSIVASLGRHPSPLGEHVPKGAAAAGRLGERELERSLEARELRDQRRKGFHVDGNQERPVDCDEFVEPARESDGRAFAETTHGRRTS